MHTSPQKIDDMIKKLVHDLSELESKGHGRFVICVTGDHSTPVDYGDHRCV